MHAKKTHKTVKQIFPNNAQHLHQCFETKSEFSAQLNMHYLIFTSKFSHIEGAEFLEIFYNEMLEILRNLIVKIK